MSKQTTQERIIQALIGEPVIISFLDGKQITGTLVGHDNYTLLVQLSGNGTTVNTLIYKHAVRYVATTGG